MDIYVAVTGNDHHPGTVQQPVATLERARHLLAGGGTAWLSDGTWYLASPLVLSPQDSGITFRSMPGARPTISGGYPVTSAWQPWERGIWRCPVPVGTACSELFINGSRRSKARYPDYDPAVPGQSGYIYAESSDSPWPHTWMKYNPDTFTRKRWEDPKGAVIHIFPGNYWGNLQWEIESVDWENHIIHFGKGGFQIQHHPAASGITARSRFFIENVFEELDTPGEWYHDPAGWLYYMPYPDEDMSSLHAEVSIMKQLVVMQGSEDNPVADICFDGIRFAHAAPTFLDLYMTPSRGDWTLHRGGAVYMSGCVNCRLTGCIFDATGGNAVFISDYNRHCRISGNQFSNIGESAVIISGSKDRCVGTQQPFPERITVEDNQMHHLGFYGKQTAGVFMSVTRRNIIRHNHIHHVPRAALCINDGTWGGHLIEGNDIHDTVLETGDHGPFNAWGRDSSWCLEHAHGSACHEAGNVLADARETTIIRHNRFVDDRGWGIDLDDGSSNYLIEDNLCIGISIKLREGDWRTVRNNIFYHGANPPGFHIGHIGNHDRFEHNIVVMSSEHDHPELDINFTKNKSGGRIYEWIGPPVSGSWLEYCDHNLLWSDLGRFLARIHFRPLGSGAVDYALEQWQDMGFDLHSIFADPNFCNPEQGDFSLPQDSPALAAGFKPFPLDQFGCRH